MSLFEAEGGKVADEKILSQRFFDQLVELLRKIRNSAAQRGDTITYADADKSDALLRNFVEASRIEKGTP